MSRSFLLATAMLCAAHVGHGQTNTLLIVADDVGVDAVSVYKEGKAPPPTPNIDALARAGVLFRNAYANPICSPTRATLHTGRYGFRTGVGAVVSYGNGTPLSLEEYTLPELLNQAGYSHALIGKWHLGDGRNGGDRGPNLAGWSHYAGHMWNIKSPQTYYSWRKVVNGTVQTSTVYATTDNINDAISWIQSQSKPWVCCICFNVAHAPFHAPPSNLHTYNLAGKNPRLQPIPFFKAMVQSMDTEIGRLLKTLGPAVVAKTNIIFVGDNGTPPKVSEAPFLGSHAKTTLYEGGTNVPLIISGPAVKAGGREAAVLVNSVDLFTTVLELSGVNVRGGVPKSIPLDGISLLPYLRHDTEVQPRRFAYAERFGGTPLAKEGAAIRNHSYKLIRWTSPVREAFFDLGTDPFEKYNLLQRPLTAVEKTNYYSLVAELARLKADYLPFGKGCAGKAGIPKLERMAGALPRIGLTHVTEIRPLAPNVSAVAGILGLSRSSYGPLQLPLDLGSYGMPGCKLFVSADVIVSLSVANGAGRWMISIPDDVRLIGVTGYQQALVLEPGTNSANTIFSNAGQLVVGSR